MYFSPSDMDTATKCTDHCVQFSNNRALVKHQIKCTKVAQMTDIDTIQYVKENYGRQLTGAEEKYRLVCNYCGEEQEEEVQVNGKCHHCKLMLNDGWKAMQIKVQ